MIRLEDLIIELEELNPDMLVDSKQIFNLIIHSNEHGLCQSELDLVGCSPGFLKIINRRVEK